MNRGNAHSSSGVVVANRSRSQSFKAFTRVERLRLVISFNATSKSPLTATTGAAAPPAKESKMLESWLDPPEN